MFQRKYSAARNPALLFIASRMIRLLPVFLIFNSLAIVMNMVLHEQVAPGRLSIIPNTLIIGYSSLPDAPFPPAWSLDIELQFYILFPIIFALMPSFERFFVRILFAAFLLGGLYFAFLPALAFITIGTVFPFAGFFLLGAFSAKRGWKPSRSLSVASLVLTLILVTAILSVPSLRGFLIRGVSDLEIAWHDAVNFVLALVLTPFALSTVYVRSTHRDRIMGDMSYVVYCSHWLARTVAKHYLSDLGRTAKAPLVLGLIITTYGVSLLLLLYVDWPLSRWRERWVARQLQPPNAVLKT